MKQKVEFNIRTLTNKQNGGGLLGGTMHLQANEFYKITKGLESVHKNDLNSILTSKEIQPQTINQTLKFVCNSRIRNQGVETQYNYVEQNLTSINSQYLDVVTTNREDNLSNIASSSPAKQQNLKSNQKSTCKGAQNQSDFMAKTHSDIVNIACKPDPYSSTGTQRAIKGESPTLHNLHNIKSSNLEKNQNKDVMSMHNQSLLIQDRSIQSNPRSIDQHAATLCLDEMHQNQPRSDVILRIDAAGKKMRKGASDVSQSLKLLKNEGQPAANAKLKPLQYISTGPQPNTEQPSKKVIQRESSQKLSPDVKLSEKLTLVKMVSNQGQKTIVQEGGNQSKQKTLRDFTMFVESPNTPLRNQDINSPKAKSIRSSSGDGTLREQSPIKSENTRAEQKKAFHIDMLERQLFKERIDQQQYVTPYQLLQDSQGTPPQTSPRYRDNSPYKEMIKANINKYEEKLLQDSRDQDNNIDKDMMTNFSDTNNRNIESIVVSKPRNTPVIDSSPTLNVQSQNKSQYKRSQVKFDRLSDTEEKSTFKEKSKGFTLGETYCLSAEQSSKEKNNLGDNSLDKENIHSYGVTDTSRTYGKEINQDKSIHMTLNTQMGNSRQNIDLKNQINSVNVQDDDNNIVRDLLNKDHLQVQKIVGEISRQQNDSTVSRASMNAFNPNHRLQSPRYMAFGETNDNSPPDSKSKHRLLEVQTKLVGLNERDNSTIQKRGQSPIPEEHTKSPASKAGKNKSKIDKLTKIDIFTHAEIAKQKDSVDQARSATSTQDEVPMRIKDQKMLKMKRLFEQKKKQEERNYLIVRKKTLGDNDEIDEDLRFIQTTSPVSVFRGKSKMSPSKFQPVIHYHNTLTSGYAEIRDSAQYSPRQYSPELKQHQNIPSNCGGFFHNRQSIQNKKHLKKGEKNPELLSVEKQIRQLAKNQLTSVFNDKISPRFQNAFRNSLKNTVETDEFGKFHTQIFGLQDESSNRHKFLSMSIDSCDVNQSFYNQSMFTNTDRNSMRNQKDANNTYVNCNNSNYCKTNRTQRFPGSQFCHSMQVDNNLVNGMNCRLIKTDYGTKWVEVTGNCNFNTYGYKKKDDVWVDYVPQPVGNGKNTAARNFNADHSLFNKSLINLQNFAHVRNVATVKNDQTRLNYKKQNPMNYYLQKRMIYSQGSDGVARHDSKLILPEENIIDNNKIGEFNKKKSSEQKEGNNGQYTGRSGAEKSNITNSQKIKAHETFMQCLSQTASQKQKGTLRKIIKFTPLSTHKHEVTSNKYEINVKIQNTDSAYLDDNHQFSPMQMEAQTNSMFIQKIQQRNSSDTKTIYKQKRSLNKNKDIASSLVKDYKNKTRTSHTSDEPFNKTGPIMTHRSSASQQKVLQDQTMQNQGSSNKTDFQKIAQKTLPLVQGDDKKDLREKEERTPATLMVPDNSGDGSLGKIVNPANKIERNGLNDIDEKSQINEATTSDIVSNEKGGEVNRKSNIYSRESNSRDATRKSFNLQVGKQTFPISFEEDHNNQTHQTLSPKINGQYQETVNSFEEFSLINNLGKNITVMKYNSQQDPRITMKETHQTPERNKQTTENTFCLKESSMKTDQSPSVLKYINSDIHNIKNIQENKKRHVGRKLTNDQLIMIKASPSRRKEAGDSSLSPPIDIHERLTSTYGEYYDGHIPKRDKIKVQIAKIQSPSGHKNNHNQRYQETTKPQKQKDNHYVEPQFNGVPMAHITHNMQIAPSQVIMSTTPRDVLSRNYKQRQDRSKISQFNSTQQSPRQSSGAQQIAQMFLPNHHSPVAYLGKKKHYDNPNVFFQLNPRQIQGRIMNLGENYAQQRVQNSKHKKKRDSITPAVIGEMSQGNGEILHSNQQYPQTICDSFSKPFESARTNTGENTYRTDQATLTGGTNDLNFIDFNHLEVIGQPKKTNVIVSQQRNRRKRQKLVNTSAGSSTGSGMMKFLDATQKLGAMGKSMVTSFNSTNKNSEKPSAMGMKESGTLDESAIGVIQQGFEFVGDTNPRYNSKVVISSAQKNIWSNN